MALKKIVVAGGGVLGSQIAFQSRFSGFDVTIWLRSESSIGRTQPKLNQIRDHYLEDLEKTKSLIGNPMGEFLYPRALIRDFQSVTPEQIDELKKRTEETLTSIKLELDMKKAFADADLVIEAMSENPEQKIAFYEKLAPYLPEKAILCTNSSTLLPSTFAKYTGRPEKYLALHFANEIWKHNTAEVMGHAATDPEIYKQVSEFAAQIGMVPLELHKEQPGYILNSLLVPFLNAAQGLWVNGVADPATVDLTWKLATGAPAGPFQILDIVGLTTPYEIINHNPEVKTPGTTPYKIAQALKAKIDKGELGVSAGKGFYDYKK
ncbi:MAG: 3-hydroxyacyl-CoA dehydrogenase [Peptoniphilaceae bacterium]|nr:3-hydroxyacyl-CoA dehydrogenase [Peptoniphilaceae bacterium]MDD7434711.1 3-hydroxyacyl-CoA dehydrogenase [Peptoniphilaceae bacterium]MDD7543305.1 3-hydroxyacyl-CoA dehydrogenase [Peptoniphilaceae bacterium]MDY3075489.1 3-hydroxyacyl-CoA dehydrogenase [Peptoniphilaceae bacterium]MDY4196490.1 3-hydroxyacyl-CoA dehydrogenase [Peptoniphilaceae bacterium]